MKKFYIVLAEEQNSSLFTLDSRQENNFTFNQRAGILKREYNKNWTSKALELKPGSVLKEFKITRENICFSPRKLLKDHSYIISYLKKKSKHWKIAFRVFENHRIIIKGNKLLKNEFKHFSILIKIFLQNQTKLIEIGEGNVSGLKFNQNGLSRRIEDVLTNNRNKKKISLKSSVPVILNSGGGGILLHELLGHCLEADYISQGVSPFTVQDIGKKILPESINLTTKNPQDTFFKNIRCDDEGEKTETDWLIRQGKLVNIMSDYFYKKLLNLKSSGFCRVEDFTCIPRPRMYALYLQPGKYSPDDLLLSTPLGIYAGEFGNGKVSFKKNSFYFDIHDARLIEKGKLSTPLGSLTLKGNILSVLQSIEKIANDFRFDHGNSYCHKNGQMLPVRIGQPSVKINNLSVVKSIYD